MDEGEEVEGDEDWRYGPLGRAGVLKDAEPPVKADKGNGRRSEMSTGEDSQKSYAQLRW